MEIGDDVDLHTKDIDELNRSQLTQQLAWLGLVQLPTLYDQTFGTNWRGDLSERISEIREQVEKIRDDG